MEPGKKRGSTVSELTLKDTGDKNFQNMRLKHVYFSAFNPFSPAHFLVVAKMILPKHSAPYWYNPV